jgi:tetratricopeptide (TPR) repeat protein
MTGAAEASDRIARIFADAVQQYRGGRIPEAETRCRDVLALTPDHAGALHLLGMLALMTGRPAEAITPLARAASLRPDQPVLHNLLGAAYLQLNRHAEAIPCLEAALRLKPDFAEAQCALGVALGAQGRRDAAVAAFQAALRLDPSLGQAHFNLAGLFAAHGLPAPAVTHYRAALRLAPDDVVAHNELGILLSRQGEIDASLHHLRTALRLKPGLVKIRHNIGGVLSDSGRWAEALAAYEDAVRAVPDSAEAEHNLAVALLLQGRMTEGWAAFESRWRLDTVARYQRPFPQPPWAGEDLAGRTLLVHEEQGFGDTLQFCRYVPALAERCDRLVFEIRPELVPLLRRSLGSAQLDILPRSARFPGVDGLPATDFHCPLLSVPRILGTIVETIPATVPYLHADPAAVSDWAARLAALPRPRIALVWAGQPALTFDAERSIALAELAPLARVSGVSFVSLQKGPGAAQAAAPPPGLALHDFTSELKDFADSAALLGAIDLVITVDTAAAHLAGGLGKTVWLLNRHWSDWRWLLTRDDSPWYPTLRQFRQPRRDDWTSVVAQVAEALQGYVRDFR